MAEKIVTFIILGLVVIVVISFCVNSKGCKDMLAMRIEREYKRTTMETPGGKIIKEELTTKAETPSGGTSDASTNSTATVQLPTVEQILQLQSEKKLIGRPIIKPGVDDGSGYVTNHTFNGTVKTISFYYNGQSTPQLLPPNSEGVERVEILNLDLGNGQQAKYFVYYCPEYHEATIAWIQGNYVRYEKYRCQ